MSNKTQYWIVVASKDHVQRGVEGDFMQANHGMQAPLKRLEKDDWIVFYSSKQTYGEKEPLQAFTAIGQVADGESYQHKMSDDFMPYRRNIDFYECDEVPIAPLIEKLDFIENKRSWGYKFRFGFFEIPEHDFKLIQSAMIKDKPIKLHA